MSVPRWMITECAEARARGDWRAVCETGRRAARRLHRIHQFEHAELLPRLLAAGLDVNALDRCLHTPMVEAAVHSAPYRLLRGLHEAGAEPRLSLPDPDGWPVG